METIRENHGNLKGGTRSESVCSLASSTRAGLAVSPGEEELEIGMSLDRVTSFDQRTTRGSKHSSGDGMNSLVGKLRVKHGHTELIAISGAAGCGKSSLVQNVASTARTHGYFTSAKFDQVKKTTFFPDAPPEPPLEADPSEPSLPQPPSASAPAAPMSSVRVNLWRNIRGLPEVM